MTIETAIQHLINSEEFKTSAKISTNAKLRVYLSRYKKGTLSDCGGIELLNQFGYTIEIKRPKKNSK